ncbi:MAG: hypothetical protein ACK5Q5_05340 [Planctomycetaceae bacterium]
MAVGSGVTDGDAAGVGVAADVGAGTVGGGEIEVAGVVPPGGTVADAAGTAVCEQAIPVHRIKAAAHAMASIRILRCK